MRGFAIPVRISSRTGALNPPLDQPRATPETVDSFIARTLGAALRHGGDFAEVFAGLRAAGYAGGLHVELSRHSHDAVATAKRAMESIRSYA